MLWHSDQGKIGKMHEAQISELLAHIRMGKKDSFERLLSLMQNTVFSFGIKVCGETEDARDTMQETLLKAFQSLPATSINDPRAFKVWLYKVAKNSCLMMRRKGKFEPAVKLSLDALLPAQDHAHELADWSTTPIRSLLKREMRFNVRKAIRRLPHPYRLVLILRDMEQLSTSETSQVLGISEETTKIRLHRARLFLRNELEKHFVKTK
jgi:RNA polymerase sigma-70 factor (ECF subfamily)